MMINPDAGMQDINVLNAEVKSILFDGATAACWSLSTDRRVAYCGLAPDQTI